MLHILGNIFSSGLSIHSIVSVCKIMTMYVGQSQNKLHDNEGTCHPVLPKYVP